MAPVLLCWPTTLDSDADGMTVEVVRSCQLFVSFVAVLQITAEKPSGKMAPDIEVLMKQRCVIEILHAEKKMSPLTFIDA
jgi:hypothetical protein